MDAIKLGIIGAMEVEVRHLREKLTQSERFTFAGIHYDVGILGKTRVVISQCGIGKVFASACTQNMITKFAPQRIINIGVCGAVSKLLDIGDIIVGQRALQYDMDTSAIGDPVGLISGINKIYFDCDQDLNAKFERILRENGTKYLKGTIATGDRFLNSSGLVEKLRTDFDAISGDMESAAIGQVCYINGIGYAVLRSISDKGDENSGEDYQKSVEFAAEKASDVVLALCENTEEN